MDNGKGGLWLKLLDAMNLEFTYSWTIPFI